MKYKTINVRHEKLAMLHAARLNRTIIPEPGFGLIASLIIGRNKWRSRH